MMLHSTDRIDRVTDTLTRWVVVALGMLMLVPLEAVQAAVAPPAAVVSQKMADGPVADRLPADAYHAAGMHLSRHTDLRQSPAVPELPDPQAAPPDATGNGDAYLDAEVLVKVPADTTGMPVDTTRTEVIDPNSPYGLDGKLKFNPSPERAVWLSALFPGLGQIYNRRYWKLPIIVGGFMGLGYATSWNNSQLQDYTQGYRDLLDNDPSTNSYMNFFPPNTDESSLDKQWLQSTMRSRRNFYRRNRDLCIIFVVALYLLCMVDAYVDASMAHFDISPDLSMDVAPALINSPSTRRPALGLNWAFTF